MQTKRKIAVFALLLGLTIPSIAPLARAATANMPAVWAVSIALPATINAGSTAKAQVTLMDPNGAAITSPVTLSWSSSNASVATVDQNGLVTAVAPGTATITAKAPSGSTGSIAIQVLAAPTQSATSSTSASNKKTSRNHTSETKHTNNKDSKKH